MKIIKYLFASALILIIAVSCNKGIDPIDEVAPKPDASDPTLQILYPVEGNIVRSDQEVATIVIKLVAVDDVELKSVIVQLDGAEIASYTTFKDYRRALIEYPFTNLTDGEHTLSATCIDMLDKSASQTVNFRKITTEVYVPMDGELHYFPFDGDFKDAITAVEPTIVGAPDFVNDGKKNLAYAGATDSYLELPSTEIVKASQVSVAFWMKINTVPDRSGILTLSPEDLENPGYPGIQNKRTNGFRFFREGSVTSQIIKLNVGLGGTAESWNDGGTFDPSTEEWVHLAFTVSETASTVYINGVEARVSIMETPIDWTGCDVLTIMSGAPRFTEWNHMSDLSLLDELHIFNRAISAAEVQGLMGSK